MSGSTVLILFGAAATIIYLGACLLHPYVDCRRCKGTAKRRAWWRRSTFRLCRRCAGTGRRKRIGRRMVDYWIRRFADAK